MDRVLLKAVMDHLALPLMVGGDQLWATVQALGHKLATALAHRSATALAQALPTARHLATAHRLAMAHHLAMVPRHLATGWAHHLGHMAHHQAMAPLHEREKSEAMVPHHKGHH